MLRFHGKYPIATFRAKSRHQKHPDTGEPIYYNVELWGDGKIVCDCVAGGYGRLCFHAREKKEELIKEFGSVEKAVEYYRNKAREQLNDRERT